MVNQQITATDIGFTHADFAALLDKYDYHFSPGDIVAGTVFNLEPRGALIDIGAKTAAYIPIQEMSINRIEAPEEVLQSNETREFFILTDENEDGQLTLSIRRIEYMRAWERVRQLQTEDATVRSQVFATNRGGALVRIEGLRGFIPGSHISTRKNKDDLMGEELPLKFLEVDEERNRLVLSHRRALVERKMNRLEVTEVVIGTVRGLKPYGAFIDIGGVSGLLHISEISHDHIDTPHSVFNVNDEIKVMIIDLDAERGRISLSTKQLEPEPGDMVKNPQLVYDKAEEMAEKYRQKLRSQKDGEQPADETASETSDETASETLAKTSDETAAETPAKTSDETAAETPAETSDETAAETPAETSDETASETPVATSDETAAETPVETSDETAAETPVETSDETAAETPVETSDETAAETPVETSDETAAETPVETSDETSSEMAAETSDETSNEMADEISEDIPPGTEELPTATDQKESELVSAE